MSCDKKKNHGKKGKHCDIKSQNSAALGAERKDHRVIRAFKVHREEEVELEHKDHRATRNPGISR